MENKIQMGWKLIKEYPFQKIGDIVEIPSLPEKEYKFKNTGLIIDKKLLNTNFFEILYFNFKRDDKVLYKEFNNIRLATIQNIDGERVNLKFDNGKPKTKTVNYKKISKAIDYWFFNSFLIPCNLIISSQTKIDEMNKRIELGNYFTTKEECKEFILKIKNLKTEL